MPAAKKLTVRRRTKPSNAQTKSHSSLSAKSAHRQQSTIPQTQSHPESFNQPAEPAQLPPASQSLSMPVSPERMPSKTYAPLIRTTYNSVWLKRLGIGAGVLVIAGAGYVGWTFRTYIPNLAANPGGSPENQVTQLEISPTPAPDIDRLNQLASDLSRQSSASASEQLVVNQASSSAQLTEALQSQSDAQLQNELSRYIEDLEKSQVNINNLRAYQAKATELEAQGKTDQAHQWLVEAVIHAHELAVLNGYYGK